MQQDSKPETIPLLGNIQSADHLTVCITPVEITSTPISNILCGNFIELGYGLQVDGMRAEMLFNRSFEKFTPYNNGTKEWFGLYNDWSDTSRGYKSDWSGEDWYHSGYEHNPWFAAPGCSGPLVITDNSTFVVNEPAVSGISIALDGDSVHGKSALHVSNSNSNHWGGFAQRGINLAPGEAFSFSGWFKGPSEPMTAEVRFYAESGFDTLIDTIRITDISDEYSLRTAQWRNREYYGRATFALYIPPGSSLKVDGFSLTPLSNIAGWRADVVNICEELNPRIIRFPGGCFASFYDWRRGIGPADQRCPEPSYFWGGMNYNDVGTAEFAQLCKYLGSEMMICINLFHENKRKYLDGGFDFSTFTKQSEGIKAACDWLAYCNTGLEHPMGRLRAEHGFPEPFGVKYWEMDNECGRWFTPTEYAGAVAACSLAMKDIDPTIQIGMMIYDHKFKQSIYEMLDIAGTNIDFIADRGGDEQDLETILRPIVTYNASHGTHIAYADTEWLADDFRTELFKEEPALQRTFWFNKWSYALNIPPCVMTWQRKGGDVLFFNFNNLANTHGQSAIETPKEGAFLTGAGKILALVSKTGAAWPLKLDEYTVDEMADIQVQAAWTITRKKLVVYVFNRTDKTVCTHADISALKTEFTNVTGTTISADNLLAFDYAANTNSVKQDVAKAKMTVPCALDIVVPAYSFSVITVC